MNPLINKHKEDSPLKITGRFGLSITVALLALQVSHADIVFGPAAMEQFEGFRDNQGDHHEDFDDLNKGPLTSLAELGVTFRTTGRAGQPNNLDLPVAVLPWNFVASNAGQIIGTRSGAPSYIPEGQNRYEITFDEPQLRAGIERVWNTSSLTRFYNGDDLLGEHQNTVNREFVGYTGDPEDPDDRVTRIVMEGLPDAGVFQVGISDNLFWGNGSLNPLTGLVFGPEAMAQFEDYRDNIGDQFEDFNNLPKGPLSVLGDRGVTFTTRGRAGQPDTLDLPVAVLPWDFVPSGEGQITGTRSGPPRYIPEGQNRYEIVFDTPQLRAGIERAWNTFSLTRFYNGEMLLAEHQNTVNREFVGYLGDPAAPGDRVTRIVIDGANDSGVFQVGNSDNLFWGDRGIDDYLDDDGDGIVNLLEDAFFGDRSDGSRRFLPIFSSIDDSGTLYPGIIFRAEAGGAPNAQNDYETAKFIYSIELSEDLNAWRPGGSEVTLLPASPNGDESEAVSVRFADSFQDISGECFIRIRVSRKPNPL